MRNEKIKQQNLRKAVFSCFSLFSLIFSLFSFSCKTKPPVIEEEEQEIIHVIPPEFEIISIVIIQADLVNTEFETVLKITNPNQFALQASSIKYELFGNGMFWAEGTARDVVTISANQSAETKFWFTMNFINMNRKLLDDVITMRQVDYRFKGEAFVKVEIPKGINISVPEFVMEFDISGLSDVKPQ